MVLTLGILLAPAKGVPLQPSISTEEREIRIVLIEIQKEIRRPGSALAQMMAGRISLGGNFDDLIMNLRSGQLDERIKGARQHRDPIARELERDKRLGEGIIRAYLLLDRALTALGFPRTIMKNPYSPDRDQIRWDWISERLVSFSNTGTGEEVELADFRFGKKGLTLLLRELRQ